MLRSGRNLLIVILSLTLGIIIVVVMKYCNTDRNTERVLCGGEIPSREQVAFIDSTGEEMNESVVNGKMLFEENCKSCHKVHVKSPGPGLHGITSRRDRKWIYKFVRNSKQVIESGDEYAVKLYEEYGRSEMTAFPELTDTQIDDILNYIESEQNYR